MSPTAPRKKRFERASLRLRQRRGSREDDRLKILLKSRSRAKCASCTLRSFLLGCVETLEMQAFQREPKRGRSPPIFWALFERHHMGEKEKRLRALGYVRVSTLMQAEAGHSIGEQRARIEAYCALHSDRMHLVRVEADEGASGKTLARAGLARVMEAAAQGEIDVVVVPRLDRLTRSVRDLGKLLDEVFCEGGVGLASVGEHIDTTTASGRLMLNLLTVVAQWERETISERISAAMQHMRREGKFTGHAPYGMRLAADGIHLEEDHEERRDPLPHRSKERGGDESSCARHLAQYTWSHEQRPCLESHVRAQQAYLLTYPTDKSGVFEVSYLGHSRSRKRERG